VEGVVKWTPDAVGRALFTVDDPCPHFQIARAHCPECIADALNTAFEMGRDAERDARRKERKP
jgi:hypothetical protein